MRAAAERVRTAYADVRAGGTHQARLERDIAWDVTQRRLSDLDIGESPLVFGRLDLERAVRWYVGRLAVEDEDHTPLVVDWRAPVAEPFYRATAVAPMAVVRRRHLITRKGRDVIDVDDEVFDQDAVEHEGFNVAGEGALLAALERNRTGRMGDIVATIQAEQDEAIRADIHGVLVVAGGPGTGKTAVALHRAAYLLYTHRKRLAAQGVLLVGPSPIFLRYIDEVLPSLGEDEVSLATPAALKPRLKVRATESPAAATVKGDARMAKVIATAIGDRERPMPRDVVVVLDGYVLRLGRRDSSRIVERAHGRRGSHNERRPYVAGLVLDHFRRDYRRALVRAYRADRSRLDADAALDLPADRSAATVADPTVAATIARGEAAPPEWEDELTARLRRQPEIRAALDRMWPVLSGAELVHDLFGFEALVRSASGAVLSDAEQRLLLRERVAEVADVAWTEADLALVDEADFLLGPPSAARPRSRRRSRRDPELEHARRTVEELGVGGFTNAADVLARYGSDAPSSAGDADGEPRTYGHVLVDEAQDLSA